MNVYCTHEEPAPTCVTDMPHKCVQVFSPSKERPHCQCYSVREVHYVGAPRQDYFPPKAISSLSDIQTQVSKASSSLYYVWRCCRRRPGDLFPMTFSGVTCDASVLRGPRRVSFHGL